MYKLEEIQKYLEKLLDPTRVEKCYNLITNPQLRINSEDKQWVACKTEHEVKTVSNAIKDILTSYQDSTIKDSVIRTCTQFEKINKKPRIPFYVLVIDKIID